MTAYSGFIGDLVERTQKLLKSNRSVEDKLEVTRHIILLTVGFSLAYERLKFLKSDDLLGTEKLRQKLGTDQHGRIDFSNVDKDHFSDFFACAGWKLFRLERKPPPGEDPNKMEAIAIRYEINDIITELVAATPIEPEQVIIQEMFEIIRNSFAHGGVHPISRGQIDDSQRGRDNDNISQVYLVSKWKEEIPKSKGKGIKYGFIGLNVLELRPGDLSAFWDDWRKLVLDEHTLVMLEGLAA